MSLLAVEGLGKSFGGVHAVDDVSFSIGPGEIVALIGPNGAGKSTCFNMLNGQLAPDRGRIVLDGRDLAGLPPRAVWRLGVGRTFQITATFSSMTVRENVQMTLLSHLGQAMRIAVGTDRLAGLRRHVAARDKNNAGRLEVGLLLPQLEVLVYLTLKGCGADGAISFALVIPQLAAAPGDDIAALLAACCSEMLGAFVSLTLDQPQAEALKVKR